MNNKNIVVGFFKSMSYIDLKSYIIETDTATRLILLKHSQLVAASSLLSVNIQPLAGKEEVHLLIMPVQVHSRLQVKSF